MNDGNFKLGSNHFFIILLGVGAWFFSKIDDKGETATQVQNDLTVDVKVLNSTVSRMEAQLNQVESKLDVNTRSRWTLQDHERYDLSQQKINKSQNDRIDFLEEQNTAILKNLSEIKKKLSEL